MTKSLPVDPAEARLRQLPIVEKGAFDHWESGWKQVQLCADLNPAHLLVDLLRFRFLLKFTEGLN